MGERIETPQWRDQNRTTRYPFTPGATLTARTGAVLVEGMFVDAALYPIGGGAAPLFLSEIEVDREGALIRVGTESQPRLCAGRYVLDQASEAVALVDGYGRAAGTLISEAGQLAALQAWGAGVHAFRPDAAPFVASCCVPTPEVGVRAFLLESGELVAGDVWFLGGAGVVLTARDEPVLAPDGAVLQAATIRVDAVGDPLFRRRLCSGGEPFAAGRFIKALRFVGPDGDAFTVRPDRDGNVSLTAVDADAADTALRITATVDGVAIEVAGSRLGAG